MMKKRNNNSGGGQSSLGYLFGSTTSDELAAAGQDQPKLSSPPAAVPPYGIDNDDNMDEIKHSPAEKSPKIKDHDSAGAVGSSNNYTIYHGSADGDKSTGFLVTGRPSTKVKSVPGGDSSLGYLFGDYK